MKQKTPVDYEIEISYLQRRLNSLKPLCFGLTAFLLGVAFLWVPSVFACDYDVVQVRQVQVQKVQVQRVVEVQEVQVQKVQVQKVIQVQQVVQPAVKVQVKSGIFGLRRTNVTIR